MLQINEKLLLSLKQLIVANIHTTIEYLQRTKVGWLKLFPEFSETSEFHNIMLDTVPSFLIIL